MLLFTQHLSGYYLVILQIMGRCNCFGDWTSCFMWLYRQWLMSGHQSNRRRIHSYNKCCSVDNSNALCASSSSMD
jgi:hypothetical protein